MTTATPQPIRLDFGNLPLVEAAVRASFASPVPLTFEVIERARDRLRNDFPQILEPQQFELPPGVTHPKFDFGHGQIPGVVYAGSLLGLTISVQRQVIVVRWVKQVTKDSPEYPRFPALRDTLWRAVGEHRDTSNAQEAPITVVNITYANFIRVTNAGNVLREYLSNMGQVAATENAERVHKVDASWQTRDLVDLRFSLEKVKATVREEEVDGYRLTTAAGVRLGENDDPRAALDNIHDQLQYFFRDLISDQAKREWQMKEVMVD